MIDFTKQLAASEHLIRSNSIKSPDDVVSILILYQFLPSQHYDELFQVLYSSLFEQGKLFYFLVAAQAMSDEPADRTVSQYMNFPLSVLLAQDPIPLRDSADLSAAIYRYISGTFLENPEDESLYNNSGDLKSILSPFEKNDSTPSVDALAISTALENFPQMGKQIVTSKKIVSKPFLNPLSPTVEHWIAVYEKVVGAGDRTAIDRGEFLYRSQACRTLSETDRIKLAQLLKAYDEDAEVKVNTEKGGIIWQKKELPPAPKKSKGPIPQKITPIRRSPVQEKKSAQKLQPNEKPPLAPQVNNRITIPNPPTLKHQESPQKRTLGASRRQTPAPTPPRPKPLRTEKVTPKLHPTQVTPTKRESPVMQQPARKQSFSQKTATQAPKNETSVNFSSGQTLPSEKAKKPQKSPFHIAPIKRR